MIRLAICDDCLTESARLVSLLSDYPKKNHFQTPEVFTSPEDLLAAHGGNLPYDLYLLDIVMPGMTGIELAGKIRQKQPDAGVIFFTTSREHALEAFEVSALQYLVKPVSPETLFPALEKARIWIGKQEKTMTVDGKAGLVPVRVRDIRYVEYVNHVLHYHVGTQDIPGKSIRVAFEEAVPDLFADESFLMPHRAFLVNVRHIRRMTNQGFFLDEGSFVPIAKSRLPEIRSRYLSILVKR